MTRITRRLRPWRCRRSRSSVTARRHDGARDAGAEARITPPDTFFGFQMGRRTDGLSAGTRPSSTTSSWRKRAAAS